MKNFVFGFLALVITVGQASAFPVPKPPAPTVRLELAQLPVRPGKLGGVEQKSTRLQLDSYGIVTKSTFNAAGQLLSKKEVTRISFVELEKINRLIEEARFGKIFTDRKQIHCLAIASHYNLYSADNGKVFLLRTQLCADSTYNLSPAAKVLAEKIQKFDRESRD